MGSSVDSESEAFCLKWNDFHTSLTSSFAEIRQENDLLDVTLICEGQAVQAHKLVLSASSGAFKSLFKLNLKSDGGQPVIFLWDIKVTDLNLLLNFMYEGEVNVAQENLNSFLALAERLQVRGLTTNNNLVTNGLTPKRTSSSLPSDAKRLKPMVEIHHNGSVNIKEELKDVYNQGLNQVQQPDHQHHPVQAAPFPVFNQFSYENNPPPPPPVSSTNAGFVTTNSATNIIGTPEDFALNSGPPQTALVDHQKGMVVNVVGTATSLSDDSVSVPSSGLILPASSGSGSSSQATSSTSSSAPRPHSSSQNNGGLCPHCNKTFKQLRSHIQDVHCPTPTPCPLCGKIFSSKHKMFGHKYRSCPNRTRNLVRHLQDLDGQPGHPGGGGRPTNDNANGESSQFQ